MRLTQDKMALIIVRIRPPGEPKSDEGKSRNEEIKGIECGKDLANELDHF